ncbi:MAG TPA: LysM peptidoglycan-binding domain-containing protein [Planctomycetota bacterium]|nr:LysM peptidoglycan-binding domain-containing protein [Planctomycetota bacterium]
MLERLLRAIEGNRFFFLASSLLVCAAWCTFLHWGWQYFEGQYRFVHDPMAAVAGRFNIPLATLQAANPQVTDPAKLQPGDVIQIPFAAGDRKASTYTIQEFDTFAGVAAAQGISVEDLRAANPETNPKLLMLGDKLSIPAGPRPATLKPYTLETYPEVELAPYRMVSGGLLAANNALLVLFYVFRRRSEAVATDFLSVFLGHAGTWFPLIAMGWSSGWPVSEAWVRPGTFLMAINFLVTTLGIVSLGRSWGIIPANRGVKRGGLYRFVRHPIYANYVLLYGNGALICANPGTVTVAIVLPFLLLGRAILEERVLMKDPSYAEYARTVRWRFVPFVI